MHLTSLLPRPFTQAAGLLSFYLSALAADGEAADRSATLEAIRNLENPRNLTRPGPKGELGPYQFRAATWRMHTTLPFAQALDRAAADRVAELHYDWIRRGLGRAGLPGSPYYVALAWNSGLEAAVSGRAPRSAHRYAERAANLATVLQQERSLAAAGR